MALLFAKTKFILAFTSSPRTSILKIYPGQTMVGPIVSPTMNEFIDKQSCIFQHQPLFILANPPPSRGG